MERDSNGYVVEADYIHGYFQEMGPRRMQWALLVAGLEPPKVEAACELGYGNGVSINIHAAADAATAQYGTDFIASQAAYAQRLAQAAGTRPLLAQQSFADFDARTDLPDFDFICLHGIWSWVSPANQAEIMEFIRGRLKPGGVLYLSYNVMPGWAPMLPLRHLLMQHVERTQQPGAPLAQRVGAALEFLGELEKLDPLYLRQSEALRRWLTEIRGESRAYLLHEYFNEHWHCLHFSEMARALAPAGLEFAAMAALLDHLDPLHLTPPQQALLAGLEDPVLREAARDTFINRRFRKDYWVRGARPLAAKERKRRLRAARVVLATPLAAVRWQVGGGLGMQALQEEAFKPLLDFLADGHRPRTVAEIEAALHGSPTDDSLLALAQNLTLLMGMGVIEPAQESEAAIAAARVACLRLNRELCRQSRELSDLTALASPVTGAGVAVPRFFRIFLGWMMAGESDPLRWAVDLDELLRGQGQQVQRDGRTLDAVGALLELQSQAKLLQEHYLPVYRGLGLI